MAAAIRRGTVSQGVARLRAIKNREANKPNAKSVRTGAKSKAGAPKNSGATNRSAVNRQAATRNVKRNPITKAPGQAIRNRRKNAAGSKSGARVGGSAG